MPGRAEGGASSRNALGSPILATLNSGPVPVVYRRQGDMRICIAAVERPAGLRDTVPVGAVLD